MYELVCRHKAKRGLNRLEAVYCHAFELLRVSVVQQSDTAMSGARS